MQYAQKGPNKHEEKDLMTEMRINHHHHLVTGTKSRTDSLTKVTLQEIFRKTFISNSRNVMLAYKSTIFKIAIVSSTK